jgi:hypothetical protein
VYRRQDSLAEIISGSPLSPYAFVYSLPDTWEKEQEETDGAVSVPRYGRRNIYFPISFIELLSLGFCHFSLQDQEIVVTFKDVPPVAGNLEVPPMWNRSCKLATLRQLQVKLPSMSVNLF